LLAIQVSKLVFNKGRDLPNFALKWKEESAMDQYPIIHMTSLPPPDKSFITNSEIQIDPIDKDTVLPRTSNGQKRLPITRNKDFFMETVTLQNHKFPTSQLTKESGPKLSKKQITNYKIPLKIYHQNIRGL
jgi:hypothetical protein